MAPLFTITLEEFCDAVFTARRPRAFVATRDERVSRVRGLFFFFFERKTIVNQHVIVPKRGMAVGWRRITGRKAHPQQSFGGDVLDVFPLGSFFFFFGFVLSCKVRLRSC